MSPLGISKNSIFSYYDMYCSPHVYLVMNFCMLITVNTD